MTTLYTHRNYFRDDGQTWYGRWGRNKNNACQGNGFGAGYDKGMYTDPVQESCSSGGSVMAMTLTAFKQRRAADTARWREPSCCAARWRRCCGRKLLPGTS
jgi:hypothetical protein